MNTGKKSKYWGLIVYPDSAPDDWISLLEDLYVPFAVSPLHDRDVDKNGILKKAHWHVVFQFSNSTTSGIVKRAAVLTHSPGYIPLVSGSGSYQYLTHMNQKDKFQYSSDEVKIYNGFVVPDVSGDEDDGCKNMKELFKYVRDNRIAEYSVLLDRLVDESRDDLFMLAVRNAYSLRSYLMSVHYVDEHILKCATDMIHMDEDRIPSLYSHGEYKQMAFIE